MTKILFTALLFAGITATAQTNTFPNTGAAAVGTLTPTYNFQIQKTSASPALMIGGGYSGSPRIQVYGLDSDPNAWMGLGTDMDGGPYEHSLYFSKAPGGVGRLTIGDFNGTTYTSRMTVRENGNVGIGTANPIEKLDMRGNIYLRNMANVVGGGTSINFSSYDDVHLGPKIYSYLEYAGGTSSVSKLVLSSYYGGYANELTLIGGNVGIGTPNPTDKLSVNGDIRAKKVTVETLNWPDYVFEKSYKLPTLKETEDYINKNGHLADMPSAAEIEKKGQNLGEINTKLLKKIEELTLHLIEKDKELQKEKCRIDNQQLEVASLKQLLNKLLENTQALNLSYQK